MALIACSLPFVAGCNDSDIKKAAKAANDIAAALGGLETVSEQLYASKLISGDETIAVSNYIKSATLADDQFVAQVRALKKIDPNSKAQIVTLFASLAQSLDVLNQQGVLGVKNPDAKARLQVAFQTAQAAVDVISQMLQYTPSKFSSLNQYRGRDVLSAYTLEYRGEQLPDPRRVPLWSLDALAISQLLALALQIFGVGSKVVETIRSESGLTDDEILAAAEQTNQSTRDQIAAHLDAVKRDQQSPPSSS
jgi:hypothetical protein